jgi:hypothetical protein
MGKGSSSKKPPLPGGGNALNTQVKMSVADKPNQIVICKQAGCHDISTTQSFCRFHYLASWRKIKGKEAKKKGLELDAYLVEMMRKFPEEFILKLKSEIEEMAEKEAMGESEEGTEKSGLFDQLDDDEDLDTIIHGLKVEDF